MRELGVEQRIYIYTDHTVKLHKNKLWVKVYIIVCDIDMYMISIDRTVYTFNRNTKRRLASDSLAYSHQYTVC